MKARIILLGAPASGKGTQSDLIRSRLGIESASPGVMLRRELEAGTALGRLADSYTSKGQLVPDDVAGALIDGWMSKHTTGFVLDGFPRTLPQADLLTAIAKKYQTAIDCTIFLDAPVEILSQRIANRLACKGCGRTFSRILHGVSDEKKCSACGGELVRRADDAPEAFLNRMAVYRQQTEPLVEHYAKRGLLHRVNAAKEPHEVFCELTKALEG